MYRDSKSVFSPKEQNDLLESYRRMAADEEREAEAGDWTEALISLDESAS